MKKRRYKIAPFYLNGLKQEPKEYDFEITPCLTFAQADPKEVSDLGWAVALAIKWGYWAIGLRLYCAKL